MVCPQFKQDVHVDEFIMLPAKRFSQANTNYEVKFD